MAALDGFRGATWTVDTVTVMKGVSESESEFGFDVYERIPLGTRHR